MCRSIKLLRQGEVISSPEEIEAAALQFVRKISGFRTPTARHREAFDGAVDEVSAAAGRLLNTLAATLAGRAVSSGTSEKPA